MGTKSVFSLPCPLSISVSSLAQEYRDLLLSRKRGYCASKTSKSCQEFLLRRKRKYHDLGLKVKETASGWEECGLCCVIFSLFVCCRACLCLCRGCTVDEIKMVRTKMVNYFMVNYLFIWLNIKTDKTECDWISILNSEKAGWQALCSSYTFYVYTHWLQKLFLVIFLM